MSQKSLGLIETYGLLAAVEAADAAVKSANVTLVGYEMAKGSGMTTVKVEGDVGAVKAAIAAATMAVQKIGRVASAKVIPRPAAGLEHMIRNDETVGYALKPDEPSPPPKTPKQGEPPKKPGPKPGAKKANAPSPAAAKPSSQVTAPATQPPKPAPVAQTPKTPVAQPSKPAAPANQTPKPPVTPPPKPSAPAQAAAAQSGQPAPKPPESGTGKPAMQQPAKPDEKKNP